jgi:hypothetical protein
MVPLQAGGELVAVNEGEGIWDLPNFFLMTLRIFF